MSPSSAIGGATTGSQMLSRARSAVRSLLHADRSRRHRQPRLLAGPPSPNPRLPQAAVDPNARFVGEQMGSGGGEA
jgi:hypothetical protein